MKSLFTVLVFIFLMQGCTPKKALNPEPHLELGQEISFAGSSADRSYIIIGYRKNYDGQIEKTWSNQDYVVFIYVNNFNDVKQATIHRNALLKK